MTSNGSTEDILLYTRMKVLRIYLHAKTVVQVRCQEWHCSCAYRCRGCKIKTIHI